MGLGVRELKRCDAYAAAQSGRFLNFGRGGTARGDRERRTRRSTNKKVSCKAGATGTSNRSVSAVLGSRGLFLPISRAAAACGASKGDTAAGY